MAKKRSPELDREVREALARISRKPGLETREQLDAEIDSILAGGLPAERHEVAQALGFRYPKKAPSKTTTLTRANLFALTQLVVDHGAPEFPNRIAAVDAAHVRRTITLGLVEPTDAGTLRLTPTGRDLVEREIEERIQRVSSSTPRVSSLVKPDLHDRVLTDEQTKLRRDLDKLERALASLR